MLSSHRMQCMRSTSWALAKGSPERLVQPGCMSAAILKPARCLKLDQTTIWRNSALLTTRFTVPTFKRHWLRPCFATSRIAYASATASSSLTQNSERVVATFTNGETVTSDALIGCDGGASKVRACVFGDEVVNYAGQVAFRTLVPMADVPAGLNEHPFAMFVGAKRYFLHYPLRHRTIMNVIAVGREPKWQDEGWRIPATVEEFSNLYGDLYPPALQLIRAISPGTVFKWGLRDREPLAQYTKGRVTTLGDAAHPMTPFLGQGACLAIEDAMVLGRAFAAANTLQHAFVLYENTRKQRANGVQLASRRQGDEIQGATARGPNPGTDALDRGLYAYNPVTVPLTRADPFDSAHPSRGSDQPPLFLTRLSSTLQTTRSFQRS